MAVNRCFKDAGFTSDELKDLFRDVELTDKELYELADRALIDLTQRKRQIQLHAVAINKAENYIKAHPRGIKKGIKSLLVFDRKGQASAVSIDKRAYAIQGQYHAELDEFLESYRKTKLGFAQDKEGMHNVVRALYGDQGVVDADAIAMANKWRDVIEKVRVRFNKAGGYIRKLDDWLLPQYHDPLKVAKVDFATWRNKIMPLLDETRLRDEFGRVLDGDELDEIMQKIYQKIRTDGASEIKPGELSPKAVGKLGNRHQEHRFLHFKDGESFLKYQAEFGSPDTFASMTDYLSFMSREIAAMEVLGPDPDRAFATLKDMAVKADANINTVGLDNIYANVMNRLGAKNHVMADVMGTIRHFEAAFKLGAAALSALSDTSFMAMTARYNDVPVFRMFRRYLSNLNPANKADRLLASRLGLGADYALDAMSAINRHSEVTGRGFAAKYSELTMRGSGLNIMTHAGRRVFGMEFLADAATDIRKSFDKLSPRRKQMFQRYGITPDDWEKIRKSPVLKQRGVKYIDPQSFKNDDLTSRFVGMIMTEMDYAIPEPDAYARAVLNQGTRKGTTSGEVWRTATQFKTFPVTIMMNNFSRSFAELSQGRPLQAIEQFAFLLGATTMMGTLAYQAKELSKGREALDWNDPKLLSAGFMQGGGVGILGDFLFSDVNRFGSSLAATLAGPFAADVEKIVFKIFIGDAQALARGDIDFGDLPADVVKIIRTAAPSIWYLRLATDRYIFDQMEKMADPNWNSRLQRMKRKRHEEYGKGFFWEPGELSPES